VVVGSKVVVVGSDVVVGSLVVVVGSAVVVVSSEVVVGASVVVVVGSKVVVGSNVVGASAVVVGASAVVVGSVVGDSVVVSARVDSGANEFSAVDGKTCSTILIALLFLLQRLHNLQSPIVRCAKYPHGHTTHSLASELVISTTIHASMIVFISQ
jgi:NDP-sugar pyrophosphorylase family protein